MFFRDNNDSWICEFQVRLPHTMNLLIELIALKIGIGAQFKIESL